ncbi:hypothetical protein JMUB7515_27960 [Staphylococcus aureus]
MQRSLVGSEMCIRDRYDAGIQIDNGDAHAIYNFINTHSSKELHEMGERAHQLFKDKYTREINTMTVSYTHLTLPTICSV